MVPKTSTSSSMETQDKNGGQNVWTMLLNDISLSSTPSRFTDTKGCLVLGDDLSGKSSIVSAMQGSDDHHRGSALDFVTMEIQDDDVDETGYCNMWVMDGHLAHRNLLQFALPKDMFSHTIGVIVVDMSQPWNIPESLDKWINVLASHVNDLGIPHQEIEECKEKLLNDFKSYVEPGSDDDSFQSESITNADASPPAKVLDSSTLSANFGLPLIVVCTKCDSIENLEGSFDYSEEHFDFIQHYLRKFCLQYGAALIYTSLRKSSSTMKENKNIEVLKKYILHKLYGFKFTTGAMVVDRDSVFVPSGWDSENKIGIVKDNFSDKFSGDDSFENVIQKPPSLRKFIHDYKEITVDDEQTFLKKAQDALSKAPTAVKMRPHMPAATSPSPAAAAVVGKDMKVANNERMLANFFNSLLNKKPGAGGGSPAGLKTPGGSPASSALKAGMKRESLTPRSKPAQSSNETSGK